MLAASLDGSNQANGLHGIAACLGIRFARSRTHGCHGAVMVTVLVMTMVLRGGACAAPSIDLDRRRRADCRWPVRPAGSSPAPTRAAPGRDASSPSRTSNHASPTYIFIALVNNIFLRPRARAQP